MPSQLSCCPSSAFFLILNQVIDSLPYILCRVTSICTSRSPFQLSPIRPVSRRLTSMELINKLPWSPASCWATKGPIETEKREGWRAGVFLFLQLSPCKVHQVECQGYHYWLQCGPLHTIYHLQVSGTTVPSSHMFMGVIASFCYFPQQMTLSLVISLSPVHRFKWVPLLNTPQIPKVHSAILRNFKILFTAEIFHYLFLSYELTISNHLNYWLWLFFKDKSKFVLFLVAVDINSRKVICSRILFLVYNVF